MHRNAGSRHGSTEEEISRTSVFCCAETGCLSHVWVQRRARERTGCGAQKRETRKACCYPTSHPARNELGPVIEQGASSEPSTSHHTTRPHRGHVAVRNRVGQDGTAEGEGKNDSALGGTVAGFLHGWWVISPT